MFSKKPQLAHQTAAPAPAGGGPVWKKLAALPVANPLIGVAAAAALLLGSIAALVATGDPDAGAPSVRVALGIDGGTGSASADGMAEAMPYGEFDPSMIDMMPLEAMSGAESPYGAEIVVTLESGEQQRVTIGRQAQPLPKAPIAGLAQPGPSGLLPIIAADGRTPAQAYARPFTPNGKPKVAIVVGGLGIDPVATRQAIERLPPEVTLSFALRDTPALQSWIDLARAHGHEVLIDIPMEPRTFPQDDPGPGALMANAPAEETLRKLDALLGRATGYFGVTNYMGSKFLTTSGGSDAFATGLRRRGLAFVDDGLGAQRVTGVPRATADKVIDEQPGVDTIGYQLAQLEETALRRGQALGAGFGWPITINQVTAWAQGLEARGIQLAPVSALTARR